MDYFRFNLRRWISGFGTTSSERRLVPLPGSGIKLAIYYTSIKQRERTLFRQLIFPQLRLWREPKKPPRAYVPSRPAVKSEQPHVEEKVVAKMRPLTISGGKDTKILEFCKVFGYFFVILHPFSIIIR